MMAVRMERTEVDRFLSKLAQFLRENEEYLSQDACRDSFNALRGDDKSALERLASILRKRRRRKLPEPGDDDDDDNDDHDDGGDDSDDNNGSVERVVSGHDYMSDDSDSQSEDEGDLLAKETNPSGDESDMTENGSLSGTNFKSSTVAIRRPLREILRRCKRDHEAFFEEFNQSCPTSGGLGVAFCKIRQDGQRSDLRAIHRRFDLRNFYLSAVRSGYHTGKSWRWNARKQLAADIKGQNPLLPMNVNGVSEELHYYVELGRGYEAWVESLGHPGYLIALPLEVSETEYTCRKYRKYLPMAARRFRRLGIGDIFRRWKLRRLGNYISRELEARFRHPKEFEGNRKRAKNDGPQSSRKRPRHDSESVTPTGLAISVPPPNNICQSLGLESENRSASMNSHENTRSEDSPITSLLTAAAMTDVNDNIMPGAPNSSPTHIPLEPSAVCNAKHNIVQATDINTNVQQNDTNFADSDGQTHQVRRNGDIYQIQVNHTQNGTNSTSAISSEAPVIPLATFDPDPFLQDYFDYFDAQRYVLGPPDIMPFDAEPCGQLNLPMTDFDSSLA